MAEMIYDDIRACSDCICWIANADDSGLDNYSEEVAEEMRAERDAGIQSFNDENVTLVVGDDDYGFSHSRCDICDGLAGDRYQVVGLR